jgi:hypothetical protein
LALAVAVLLTHDTAAASEPRAVAGQWEQVGETDWLLRDPLTAHPVALLEDPFGWLLRGGGQGVIDTAWTSHPAGLDVMNVEEVSPEFWAQPSAWNMFQRGPSMYSGFGRDAGPREWAGRPDFDRRAYDLDSGWQVEEVLATPPTPGVGPIKIQVKAGLLALHWQALAGRVYVIEFTPALTRPFQTLQTLGSLVEGDMSMELPMSSADGFYRIAEQVY